MSRRKMVRKIINIIKGWWFYLFNKNEQLANKRISICKKCEYCVHIESLGDICDECGCILDAKTRVEDEKCELNKW